jgi:hypothetical protein
MRSAGFFVQKRDWRPASPGFFELPLLVDPDLILPRSGEVIPARADALAHDVKTPRGRGKSGWRFVP